MLICEGGLGDIAGILGAVAEIYLRLSGVLLPLIKLQHHVHNPPQHFQCLLPHGCHNVRFLQHHHAQVHRIFLELLKSLLATRDDVVDFPEDAAHQLNVLWAIADSLKHFEYSVAVIERLDGILVVCYYIVKHYFNSADGVSFPLPLNFEQMIVNNLLIKLSIVLYGHSGEELMEFKQWLF